MATKKKAAAKAAPATKKKAAAKAAPVKKVVTSDQQAWERGESVPCEPDTSEKE